MSSPLIRFDDSGRMTSGSPGGKIAIDPLVGQLRDDLVSVPSTISDEANGTPIPVGGSASGLIDSSGDTDVYSISLIAGHTYTVSLHGTGATPLLDSFLQIGSPTNTLVIQDDDGGNGLYSIATFTAATSGTYSVVAASFANQNDPGTGGYTVNVFENTVDSVGDTNATAATIGLGTTFGARETGTDTDRYAITLEAGQYYTFKVAGGADYNTDPTAVPTGELDTFITLRSANGDIVAQNDDNSYPSDISSGVGFLAQTGGTYYLDVQAYAGQTGGYVLDATKVDIASLSPLDSIDWRNADNVPFVNVNNVPTAYVYFGQAGENFGETGDDGVTPMVTFGWNDYEKQQVMEALHEYEKVFGTHYEITTDVNQATFRLSTTSSDQYGAYFYPQDPSYGSQQGIGVFNVDSGGWSLPGQASLQRGGYAFAVILHEFGHAHGLAHPHDNGGGSDVMLGVTAPTGSLGLYDLNQGVYTVMSYNDAWVTGPDGPSPYTRATVGYGWSGSLSAFDIAELQTRYGVHDENTGNDVYVLQDKNATGTFYQTIWDTGGTDTIVYNGARHANIDLLAATLDYSKTGGGLVSFVDDIYGGYTIANGVVIENATGGSGNDTLLGNEADNILIGNAGDDKLVGRGGNDTASYITATSAIVANLNSGKASGGAGNDTFQSIENLTGSNFNDVLTGSNLANMLSGGKGNDKIYANGGNDLVFGGDGIDTITLGAGNDTFVAEAGTTRIAGKAGRISLDVITDLDQFGNDVIDVSRLGSFTFKGMGDATGAGDLTYKTYADINVVESLFGTDLDGKAASASAKGPVTVVYGNVDGGEYDVAIVLLSKASVGAADFILSGALSSDHALV